MSFRKQALNAVKKTAITSLVSATVLSVVAGVVFIIRLPSIISALDTRVTASENTQAKFLMIHEELLKDASETKGYVRGIAAKIGAKPITTSESASISY